MDHLCASKNYDKVKDHIEHLETQEGNFSQLGMWKLKKKLCPESLDPPMAKVDKDGNLVTSHNSLKRLYLDTYVNRLKHRKMKPEMNDIFCLKMELWSSRMTQLRNVTSLPWEMKHLDQSPVKVESGSSFI